MMPSGVFIYASLYSIAHGISPVCWILTWPISRCPCASLSGHQAAAATRITFGQIELRRDVPTARCESQPAPCSKRLADQLAAGLQQRAGCREPLALHSDPHRVDARDGTA